VALFGIPIGAGGVGVLVGLLGAVAGLLVAYFAVTGGLLLVGALFMLVGLIRFAMPHLWDNLVSAGFIQMNGPPAEFLDRFSPVDQGIIMIVLAGIFGVAGLGLYGLVSTRSPILRTNSASSNKRNSTPNSDTSPGVRFVFDKFPSPRLGKPRTRCLPSPDPQRHLPNG
jgi:hypothetical protein